MRFARKLIPALLVVLAGVVSLPTSVSPVRADNTPQLQAQRAQLLQQLAAITPQRNGASSALSGAESAYNQAASALNTAHAQLDALNAKLASLAGEITADQDQESSARQALATFTRATYESVSGDTMMAAVLNAKDFSGAMDSLSGAASISTQIQGLENTLDRDQADLAGKQRQLQTDFAQASALENQLSDQTNQLLTVVYQRNQLLSQLSGPARQIAAQIAQIDSELAAPAPQPGGTPHTGSCRNTFAYGECTWYVATRRCIPWSGNADAWYYNAARMGYAEGHVPQVGAVAVWLPYRGGASYVGHVAYVQAVGPAPGIPAGSFEVSEMNWGGWNRVDYRVVQNDPSVFQGFIY